MVPLWAYHRFAKICDVAKLGRQLHANIPLPKSNCADFMLTSMEHPSSYIYLKYVSIYCKIQTLDRFLRLIKTISG